MEKPLIIFDGYCNLCSGIVRMLIKIDKNKSLRFVQSTNPIISEFLSASNPEINPGETIILFYKDRFHYRSEAIIEIFKLLPKPLYYLKYFRFVPKFIRDWVYGRIADSRYSIFGRKDECMIPDDEWRDRFINSWEVEN